MNKIKKPKWPENYVVDTLTGDIYQGHKLIHKGMSKFMSYIFVGSLSIIPLIPIYYCIVNVIFVNGN